MTFQTLIRYIPKSKIFCKNIYSKEEYGYSDKFFKLSQKLLRRRGNKVCEERAERKYLFILMAMVFG